MNNHELQQAIKKFETMMKKYPDNKASVLHFKTFLLGFLRIKTTKKTLPTAELMTIIKHEKPVIFALLRNFSSYSMIFDILTHIDMDYEKAKDNIETLKKN